MINLDVFILTVLIVKNERTENRFSVSFSHINKPLKEVTRNYKTYKEVFCLPGSFSQYDSTPSHVFLEVYKLLLLQPVSKVFVLSEF